VIGAAAARATGSRTVPSAAGSLDSKAPACGHIERRYRPDGGAERSIDGHRPQTALRSVRAAEATFPAPVLLGREPADARRREE